MTTSPSAWDSLVAHVCPTCDAIPVEDPRHDQQCPHGLEWPIRPARRAQFIAWRKGETKESGAQFFGGHPESVAIELIEREEAALCEYPVARGDEAVDVMVEVVATGEITCWKVQGNARPRYFAEQEKA